MVFHSGVVGRDAHHPFSLGVLQERKNLHTFVNPIFHNLFFRDWVLGKTKYSVHGFPPTSVGGFSFLKRSIFVEQ